MLKSKSIFSVVFVIAASLALASCSSLPRETFSEREQSVAEIPGMPNVRFFADAPLAEVVQALDEKALQAAARDAGSFEMLAISGGAWDGAFGAGVMNGWTKSGKRPKFVVVTGVSAGSLIAPFAFMGPKYDPQLKSAFTSGEAEPVGDGTDNLLTVLGGGQMRRGTLHALVSHYVDEPFLRAIAAEHRRGRRLLVVTTNLDAQRAVVWNMGAIAASGDPHALELFRNVLTASSSVPGVFEPTRVTVTANGRQFEELHVDGGVTTNVFTMPDAVLTANGDGRGQKNLPGNIYVVMNTRLTPEFEMVDPKVSAIVGRSLSTLLKAHSKATVQSSQQFAQAAGIRFNLTHIGEAPPKHLKPGFNTKYMRAIYALGYVRASEGNLWQKAIALQGRL
jgi:hypothetical protein